MSLSNNVPVVQCHGAEKGVPLHPRMFCLCKSGRLYANCFKRRYYFRESLESTIPLPRVSTDPQLIKQFMSQFNKNMDFADRLGLSDAEKNNMPIFPSHALISPKELAAQQRKIF